jgi:hypothetical protein
MLDTRSSAAANICHPASSIPFTFLHSQGAGCKALWKVLIYCKEPITKAMPAGRIAYRLPERGEKSWVSK